MLDLEQYQGAVQDQEGLDLFYLCVIFILTFTKVTTFRERVRERDQVCVISRKDARPWYFGQNSCHIMPRSHFSFVKTMSECADPISGRVKIWHSILLLKRPRTVSIACKMVYFWIRLFMLFGIHG